MKNIAQEFELTGVPLRHTLRSTNNKETEFANRKKKNSKPKKPSKTTIKMEDLKKKYGDFTIWFKMNKRLGIFRQSELI